MTGLNRRTIMKGDAPGYRGEHQIQEYYNAANKTIERKVRGIIMKQPCPYPEDSQRTFLTLWASACREGEAIMLHPDDFKWDAMGFGSPKIPVLKKREKVRDETGEIIYKEVTSRVRQQDGSIMDQIIYRPESKRKLEYREHLVPRDMPLIEEFIKILTSLQENGYKYILYRHTPWQRFEVKDEPCSTTIVQDRINELHPKLVPHGIRGLHIRYLYDRAKKDPMFKFDIPELKKHLKWSSDSMAVYYLSSQELADKMGITKPW